MTTPALVPAGNIIADPALKSAIETGSVEPHQGFHALMRLAWGEVLALLLPPSAATKGEPGHVKSFSACLEQRIIQLPPQGCAVVGSFVTVHTQVCSQPAVAPMRTTAPGSHPCAVSAHTTLV